jgi:phage gpG-like protein
MGLNLSITVDLSGDRTVFERAAKALRKPRDLMRRIGVLAMSRGQKRLRALFSSSEEAIRSGRLLSSLGVSPAGAAGSDGIFELEDARVRVGSNVPYAAQFQFGGTIVPKEGKALAIPLLPQLKRAGLWPRALDPKRELLQLIPGKGGGPAVLINPEAPKVGRQRKARGVLPKIRGVPEFPPGPLFVLVKSVTQKPKPFLFFDAEDERRIADELIPAWLGN